jgi:hypothetical protein
MGQFGEAALTSLLQENATKPLSDLKSALIDRLETHTRGVYQDDISFVIVRASSPAAMEPAPRVEDVRRASASVQAA